MPGRQQPLIPLQPLVYLIDKNVYFAMTGKEYYLFKAGCCMEPDTLCGGIIMRPARLSPETGKITCVSRWSAVAIVSLLAALIASGCAVGPDFVQPEPAMPDMWHQQLTSDMGTGESVQQTWWKQFNFCTIAFQSL